MERIIFSENRRLAVMDAGLIDYRRGCELQAQAVEDVQKSAQALVILCEHPPVITVGRGGSRENIRLSPEELRAAGIPVVRVDRGGDVTYHGPGQLVIYPICDLKKTKKDVHLFLRNLERLAVEFLAELGVAAGVRPGLTGVWCGNEKIASIGIGVKHWITYHGMAVNIHRGVLERFSSVRPCGMDVRMTTVESLVGSAVSMESVKMLITRRLCHDQCGLA